MKASKMAGIAIIVLVIIFATAYKTLVKNEPADSRASSAAVSENVITLKGMIGSEKEALFNDADIRHIAKTKYGIVLDTLKAGSLEMTVPQTIKEQDFLFPASPTVVEKLKASMQLGGSDEIFRTPLVYYSWDKVVQALQAKGIASKQKDQTFAMDNAKLVGLVAQDRTWNEVGLDLYGPVVVDTSDPTKSNSGNSFAAMAAASLSPGGALTETALLSVMPQVQKLFAKSGFKKSSTTDLFNEYMTTGMGSHKIIVGYESDLLYFAKQNASAWKTLKSTVSPRIVYPSPTLWSTHTIIPLTPGGKRMTAFLKDHEVQSIAWTRYGFRSAIPGIVNDPASHDVEGISTSIDHVMPFPDYATMDRLLAAFGNR